MYLIQLFCKIYIYVKDLTGNIIGIYNEYGKEVARYEYDAYGNHEVLNENGTINNNATFIGNINPFRYKGYYYDVETSLYYCNSRYYNSKIYRWISADDINYLEPESIASSKGLNYYHGLPGYSKIARVSPSMASKLGWANNYRYISNVMRYGGKIYNLGGPATGSYGKELALLAHYFNLINL